MMIATRLGCNSVHCIVVRPHQSSLHVDACIQQSHISILISLFLYPKLDCHCMAIIWYLSSAGRAPPWSGGRPWFDSMRHHCNQSYTKYDLNNINYLGDVKGIHVSSNLALIIKFLILLSWDGKAVFLFGMRMCMYKIKQYVTVRNNMEVITWQKHYYKATA